jgi:hypothetical protein
MNYTALCLIAAAAFAIWQAQAQAQELTPEEADCTNLTELQCLDEKRRLSSEWAKRLAEARKQPDGWSVGCVRDKVTLEWGCHAVKHIEGGTLRMLRITHSKRAGYCFSAANNTHPGRIAVIRIGDNEPIGYEDHTVCDETAAKIIEQLMGEQEGATRGTAWPSKTDEFAFDAKGFPTAFEALKDRVANPRS